MHGDCYSGDYCLPVVYCKNNIRKQKLDDLVLKSFSNLTAFYYIYYSYIM